MQIDVKHTAMLAKLRFSDEELAMLEDQMSRIVAMVENLPELDGELTPDSSKATAFRADRPAAYLSRDELLANTPVKQAGCFVVPKTVKGE